MIEVIGHGGGGIVWLQRKTEGLGSVGLRAVKGIQTSADVNTTSISRRFVRELEASAKFSQEKVSQIVIVRQTALTTVGSMRNISSNPTAGTTRLDGFISLWNIVQMGILEHI